KPAILLVEDEFEERQMLAHLLRAHGFRVITAADGRAGLSAIKRARPRLVLLDLIMPRMDGFEFLRKLRELRAGKSLPVVIITGESGVVAPANVPLLNKPIDGDQLVGQIRGILEEATVH